MSRRSAVMVGVLVSATIVVAPRADQNPPAFRSQTTAVSVDVAVTDGNRPVADLTTADFVVRDNGVVQMVTELSFGTLPIDVRIVFDTSSSVSDAQLISHGRAMQQVGGNLSPEDRAEVFKFKQRPLEVLALRPPPISVTIDRNGPEGTNFYDSVSLAMITTPKPGRRQLAIVLSDGIDTGSFFDWPLLESAARRSDAVVYTVSPPTTERFPSLGDPTETSRLGLTDPQQRTRQLEIAAIEQLDRLARMTGGRRIEVAPGDDVGGTFLKILAEFRRSYVLKYVANGVAPRGWHEIAVSLTNGRHHTIRAKRGYDGGTSRPGTPAQ